MWSFDNVEAVAIETPMCQTKRININVGFEVEAAC